VRIARVVSSFSLLLLAVVSFAGQFSDLKSKLDRAKSVGDKISTLNGADIDDDEFLDIVWKVKNDDAASLKAAVDYVEIRAIAEGVAPTGGQTGVAKKIKSSRVYHDEKTEQSNWLSGAIARLKNLVPNRTNTPNPRLGGLPGMAGAGFLVYLVWFLLFALVIGFIVYALRFVAFGKMKKRKAKAMLEDDEPERTLDEWLALADAYQKEGRFREAVRALYLACLLKFDERNIARFLRGQTNWEHLGRIEASPKKPAHLNFRAATQAFDQIWYGHKVRGAVDVDEFRQWYGEVSAALKEAA
jgi:hypothetical protein